MAEIGVHGFADKNRHRLLIGAHRAVPTRPGVSHLAARKHAGKGREPRLDAALHPTPRGAHGFGNVEHAPLVVPPLAQPDGDPEIAPRPARAGDEAIVFAVNCFVGHPRFLGGGVFSGGRRLLN